MEHRVNMGEKNGTWLASCFALDEDGTSCKWEIGGFTEESTTRKAAEHEASTGPVQLRKWESIQPGEWPRYGTEARA